MSSAVRSALSSTVLERTTSNNDSCSITPVLQYVHVRPVSAMNVMAQSYAFPNTPAYSSSSSSFPPSSSSSSASSSLSSLSTSSSSSSSSSTSSSSLSAAFAGVHTGRAQSPTPAGAHPRASGLLSTFFILVVCLFLFSTVILTLALRDSDVDSLSPAAMASSSMSDHADEFDMTAPKKLSLLGKFKGKVKNFMLQSFSHVGQHAHYSLSLDSFSYTGSKPENTLKAPPATPAAAPSRYGHDSSRHVALARIPGSARSSAVSARSLESNADGVFPAFTDMPPPIHSRNEQTARESLYKDEETGNFRFLKKYLEDAKLRVKQPKYDKKDYPPPHAAIVTPDAPGDEIVANAAASSTGSEADLSSSPSLISSAIASSSYSTPSTSDPILVTAGRFWSDERGVNGQAHDMQRVILWIEQALSYSDYVLLAIRMEADEANSLAFIHSKFSHATDSTGRTRVHLIPMLQWYGVSTALNGLLHEAAALNGTYILYQSIEVWASKASVMSLVEEMNQEEESHSPLILNPANRLPLVVGGAFVGFHQFSEGQHPLSGLNSPWNTLAIWHVPSLLKTGFLSVSDGQLNFPFGQEEGPAIAVHQLLAREKAQQSQFYGKKRYQIDNVGVAENAAAVRRLLALYSDVEGEEEQSLPEAKSGSSSKTQRRSGSRKEDMAEEKDKDTYKQKKHAKHIDDGSIVPGESAQHWAHARNSVSSTASDSDSDSESSIGSLLSSIFSSKDGKEKEKEKEKGKRKSGRKSSGNYGRYLHTTLAHALHTRVNFFKEAVDHNYFDERKGQAILPEAVTPPPKSGRKHKYSIAAQEENFVGSQQTTDSESDARQEPLAMRAMQYIDSGSAATLPPPHAAVQDSKDDDDNNGAVSLSARSIVVDEFSDSDRYLARLVLLNDSPVWSSASSSDRRSLTIEKLATKQQRTQHALHQLGLESYVLNNVRVKHVVDIQNRKKSGNRPGNYIRIGR